MNSQLNKPVVSVIMPVYNGAAFLSASINCILKQTYRNIEFIIVNDGSTDNSSDVIQQFNDERIRYFFQQNSGQCAASNFGLSQAKGDYIKFFDADDIMNETHIEEQVNRLQGSNSKIASCAWGRFYNDDPNSAKFNPEHVWKDMKPIDWLKAALMQSSDMMAAWLWLIPKKIIDKTGGWNPKLSLNNDFEFSIRLLLQCDEILFVPNAKVYYRTSGQSLSSSISEKAYHDALLSTQMGCNYLLQVDDSPEMKQICANRYQEWMFRMFPNYPHLYKEFKKEVNALGGSNIKLGGGKVLKIISSLFGWKFAKRIRLYINK